MTRGVAFFLAVLVALAPAGVALAQLEAPADLLLAEIPPEIKTLVEQLYVSPSLDARVEAARKLAAMGEGAVPAIPYLVSILNQKLDPPQREAVVATLTKIGKPAVGPIIANLKAERTESRINAIAILEAIADKQAVGPLTDIALRDASPALRERALDALTHLAVGDPSVGDKFMTTVEDAKAKPEIRSRAMKALGRLAGEGLPVDTLVTMLQNPEADIRLRCAAAVALGQSGSPAAVAPLVEALKDKTASMRTWAAVALNGNAAPDAIAALIKALEDENERVRVRAADALAAVQDPKVLDPLAKVASDTNAEVRTWAVIGLGNFTDKKALDALSAALHDDDVQVRIAAADSLGRTGVPQATPYLISCVNEFGEDAAVRAAAARALGALRDSRAVPTLLGLINDNDTTLRQWVVSALGRIGDARAVEPLIGALNDKEASVRGWAALALSRFRDPRIIEPLIKAAKDPDAQVRARVVLALRVARNDPRVKAALQEATNDPDPTVQQKAKQILGATG